MDYNESQYVTAATVGTPRHKRKLGDTGFEVPDSDEDDYGWQDDDAMPNMPPQWQGSEDILLGNQASDEEGGDQDVESEEDTVPQH